MNRGTFVTTTNSRKHLISQPCQIRFQVAENEWRSEVPRERLVPVQQVLRVPTHYDINRLEESPEITRFIERRSQIRHDHVAHEHHFFVGKVNQHGIVCFTASSRDQLEFRSPDIQICSFVDRNVRSVAENIIGAESLSEELLTKDTRTVNLLLEIVPIVLSPVKPGTGVQAAEVRMTAHMVPVCVSNEQRCQRRQAGRKGLQRFVRTFCEIRPRARVNADELMPILGNNEVVFREFEARQRVDAAGKDLGNAPRCKRMTGGFVLRKRRCQGDRVIEVGIAAAPQVLLSLCCVAIIQGKSAKMLINFAQPSRMRRFVCMLKTPSEFLLCSLSLVKV